MNGIGQLPYRAQSLCCAVGGLVASLLLAFACGAAAANAQTLIEPQLVFVGAGSFVMGDSSGAGQPDELPPHEVQMRAFFIGATEVTRAEYESYARATGLSFSVGPDPRAPVTGVSWEDAKAYARWLARKARKDYRLPTEAEWEYAARAKGVHAGQFIDGNDPQSLCRSANIADTAAKAASTVREHTACTDGHAALAPVGSLAPNALGLRDMSGNVWEWTLDCYTPNYEKASGSGRAQGGRCTQRVIRGGSFMLPAESARLSNREAFSATVANEQIGFRLVRHP
jgi:formylglycine-generating enzyme required for sulfatase activity